MNWILQQTLNVVREANKYMRPWANQQWANAVVFWDEQKTFYRDVESIEKASVEEYSDKSPRQIKPASVEVRYFSRQAPHD